MAETPFKMRGFSGFGNSPLNQNEKATDKVTATARSKEIQEAIKNKSKKEKQDIVERNIHAFPYGRLKEGEKYREEMPDFMQDIATRSDSVRAGVHSLLEDE